MDQTHIHRADLQPCRLPNHPRLFTTLIKRGMFTTGHKLEKKKKQTSFSEYRFASTVCCAKFVYQNRWAALLCCVV
jgi:hypothetical protein